MRPINWWREDKYRKPTKHHSAELEASGENSKCLFSLGDLNVMDSDLLGEWRIKRLLWAGEVSLGNDAENGRKECWEHEFWAGEIPQASRWGGLVCMNQTHDQVLLAHSLGPAPV